jgi:hypothetical protein
MGKTIAALALLVLPGGIPLGLYLLYRKYKKK